MYRQLQSNELEKNRQSLVKISDAAAGNIKEDEKKQDSPVRKAILNTKSGILQEENMNFNRRATQQYNTEFQRYGLDNSHRASGVFRMTTTNLLQNTPQAVNQHRSNYLLRNRGHFGSNAVTNLNSPTNMNSPGNVGQSSVFLMTN